MTQKRSKCTYTLVLAAMLIFMLGGGAIAAVRGGVLDYLFGTHETPTVQQEVMVQPILVSGRAMGATVTIEDALFDGQRLHLGLTVAAEKPVTLALVSLMVDGEEAILLNADGLNGPILSTAAGGLTAGISHTVWQNAHADLRIRLMDGTETLDELSLPFELTVNTLTWELFMLPYEIDVNVRPMDAVLNDLRTAITLHIWPQQDGMTREEIETTFRNFRFFDEARHPLLFQDTRTIQTSAARTMNYDAWVWEVTCDLPALMTLPETIWMVPCDENGAPLWDYAITFSTARIGAENG